MQRVVWPLHLPPWDIVLSLGAEGGTQQIANNTAVDCEAFIEQERKSINVHLLFHTYTIHWSKDTGEK